MAQSSVPASLTGATLQCEQGRRWLVSDRLLGSGGFAKVYECTSVGGGGERAAVKVVDLRVQSLWAQGKLRSEADTLRRAQGSEHIVRFLGEIRLGPFQVFVLEAWGQSDLLEEVLKRQGRGLGEARARGLLAQLLEALAWLHARRICHGCARHPPGPPGRYRGDPRVMKLISRSPNLFLISSHAAPPLASRR